MEYALSGVGAGCATPCRSSDARGAWDQQRCPRSVQRAEGISLESGCWQHTVLLGLSALAEPVEMSCRGHDTQ